MMGTPCWEGLKTWDSDDPGRCMPTAYGHDHNGGIVADCLGIHQSFRKPRPILHNPASSRAKAGGTAKLVDALALAPTTPGSPLPAPVFRN